MDAQRIKQYYEEQYRTQRRASTLITTEQREQAVPVTESKFGGTPYWPADMAYPTARNGEPLYLLAQFNLADIPNLPTDFPTSGLLQFFIANNDVYGVNFDDYVAGDFRVVYHEQLSEERLTDVPAVPQEDAMLPVQGHIALQFSAQEQPLSYLDYRQTALQEVRFDDEDLADEVLFEAYGGEGHRLGGYPYFTQWDPREGEERYADYELLFQMDSEMGDDIDIMWGDCGVANFFITPHDLRQRDFSRVLYSWDCH